MDTPNNNKHFVKYKYIFLINKLTFGVSVKQTDLQIILNEIYNACTKC